MTNTPNRRRRERATAERADSIVDELRGVPFGLEHRRQLPVASLEVAYEQLRELLAGGSEQVEAFRGLMRRHEAPSAETVSAILEASRVPRPVEVGEVHYGPGTNPAPIPLGVVYEDARRVAEEFADRAEANGDLERLSAVTGWGRERLVDAVAALVVNSPDASARVTR